MLLKSIRSGLILNVMLHSINKTASLGVLDREFGGKEQLSKPRIWEFREFGIANLRGLSVLIFIRIFSNFQFVSRISNSDEKWQDSVLSIWLAACHLLSSQSKMRIWWGIEIYSNKSISLNISKHFIILCLQWNLKRFLWSNK